MQGHEIATTRKGGKGESLSRFSVCKGREEVMDEVLKKIVDVVELKHDKDAMRDGYGYLVEHYDREALARIRADCIKCVKDGRGADYFELYKLGLLIGAPKEFDSYMLYLEIDRKPEKRFYMPRRRVLKRFVDSLQDLADGKINELFVSQPPRTGKTTLALMFTTWLMGRDTEHPNLYCSYSDIITKAFYNGVLELITDPDTYNYQQIFPDSPIVRTNAQDETIDLTRKKRYPTFTARSLYGTLNGAVDVENGVIISDDLIGGIEEAMNKDRLINAWAKVDNNLLPRGKGGTKYLWIGTRWSVIDPAGIRQDLLLNDEQFRDYKWRAINIPALNDLDESNFDYKYGVGFDTKYYKQRRASFERNNDIASWQAQYMGLPIERTGALFSPDDLMFYNGELPDTDPDRVFMAVDPAWGGGDFVAAPICYQYGKTLYVADVVYDNGDKERTQPKLARKALEHNVNAIFVEATRTTEEYAEDVEEMLKKQGKRVNMQTSTKKMKGEKAKLDSILAAAPDIRNNMVFLASGHRSKEYEMFMQNVFSFKIVGKNKNDDAPDSLQMAIAFAVPPEINTVTLVRRFF